MKYLPIIVFSLFGLFICDGVRVAINEKFIDAVLQNFLPEIKKFTQGTELPDSGCLDRLKFSIPNFDLSKVQLSFTPSGLLNLKINGLSPVLEGRASKRIIVKIRKSFTLTLQNFRFDGNLKITSKYDKGVLVQDAYFEGNPSMNFKVKLSLGGGILNKILSFLLNGIANLAKGFVMPAIKKQLKKTVEKVFADLPRVITINNKYKLDVTLSSPTIMRNKFLEINSKARFYNDNIPATKTRFYKDVTFPYLTSMDSQLQIYISEYSINSVIYTLLASNEREVLGKINTSKISKMLPGITDKIGNEALIVFTGSPDVSLQVTEQNLIVDLPGTFSVRTTDNKDLVKLDLRLNLKAFVSIQNGEKITAVVNDFDFNLNKIILNTLSVDLSVINKGFDEVKPILIPLLNQFIKNKMELTFPTVMGIKFTQLSLAHKSHYLQINYNLVRTK